jgi:hypothetical protein
VPTDGNEVATVPLEQRNDPFDVTRRHVKREDETAVTELLNEPVPIFGVTRKETLNRSSHDRAHPVRHEGGIKSARTPFTFEQPHVVHSNRLVL